MLLLHVKSIAGPMVQWLAPWTLNPIIRVQISVGPFFITLHTYTYTFYSIPYNPFHHMHTHPIPPHQLNTYQLIHKIQQARPSHRCNLVNKELGYDVIIQIPQSQPLKLKNCISSARSNSELFKRIAKPLLKNIRNNIDQLYLFTSHDTACRVETSLGLSSNPGLFMIMGLTYLDEKYKENHQNCDIQVSFLEFREGKMYDLLAYTGNELASVREVTGEKGIIGFGQQWVRTTTFNHFIKLLRIALFNNKERDLTSQPPPTTLNSTLIMKLRNKIYSNEPVRSQQTVLIDFEPNCMTFSSQKDKNSNNNNRSILQYLLIDLHNRHPVVGSKPIHYHMVEENLLLTLISKYTPQQTDKQTFVNGQITIINSIPANIQTFPACHAALTHLSTTIGDPFTANLAPKTPPPSPLPHPQLQSQLQTILAGVSSNNYNSIKHFHTFQQSLAQLINKGKHCLKELRKNIIMFVKQKTQLHLMKNQLIAFEIKLIGNCIKSDHFKDFYNAKTYLQLERQVTIKTEAIKEEIKEQTKHMEDAEMRFMSLLKRQTESFNKFNQQSTVTGKPQPSTAAFNMSSLGSNAFSSSSLKQNWQQGSSILPVATAKFKRVSKTTSQGQQLQQHQLRRLLNQLNEQMFSIFNGYLLYDQRTVAMSALFEQQTAEEELQLENILTQFVIELEMVKETDIICQQDNNIYHNNEAGLFRGINFLGLIGNKKNNTHGYQIGKRIIIGGKEQPKTKHRYSLNKILQPRLPLIHKTPPIIIPGNLKISQLLTNPQQQHQTDKPYSLHSAQLL